MGGRLVPVPALLELFAQLPALTGNWALDGDTALLGYGVPVEAVTVTVAIRDDYTSEAGLDEARAAWGDELSVRRLRPWPDPVLMKVALDTAEPAAAVGLVPVLPLEHVRPDSPQSRATFARWAARVTLSE